MKSVQKSSVAQYYMYIHVHYRTVYICTYNTVQYFVYNTVHEDEPKER